MEPEYFLFLRYLKEDGSSQNGVRIAFSPSITVNIEKGGIKNRM